MEINISTLVQQRIAILLCVGWLQLSLLSAQEPSADGIHWATESGDGVLTGLKLSPNGGVIAANQPLEFQFVLKNTTEERKRIECFPISTLFLDLRADNVLFVRDYRRPAAGVEVEIDPGEVVEPQVFRLSLQTTQMLPGSYTIDSLIGVSAKGNWRIGNKQMSLGTLRKIPFTISEDLSQAAPVVYPPEQSDVIFWGEPLMGISVGAQLVQVDAAGRLFEKSSRFHVNETLTLQLFLHNQRDTPVTIEVIRGSVSDPWELSIFTEAMRRRLLRLMNRDLVVYKPLGLITLQPDEQLPLTGVEIESLRSSGATELDPLDSAPFPHAAFDMIAVGQRMSVHPRPLLETELGNYFATATVRIQLHGTDFSAAVTSGLVPFRVVENPLRRERAEKANR